MQSGSTDQDALGIVIDDGENASAVLGLPPNPSPVEAREAFIRLAKRYHPDTHPNDPVAERRFKLITKAYDEWRSSYYFRRSQIHRAPEAWGSYRQSLAIAVMFLVLAPLAIFLVTRGEPRPVQSPELRQAERTASERGAEIAGVAPANEQGQAPILAPQAPPPQFQLTVAPSDGIEPPTGQNGHEEVALAQPEREDAPREPAIDPAPRYENEAKAETTGVTAIVPPKTLNAAVGNKPGRRRGLKPEAARSASAALSEHSLDRAVLAAAPGG